MDAPTSDERHVGMMRSYKGRHSVSAHAPRFLIAVVATLMILIAVVAGVIVNRVLVNDAAAQTGPGMRVAVLERGVRDDSEDVGTRRQLAFAYQQAGRPWDALRQYEEVLSREADDVASLYNSGLVRLSVGQTRMGEQSLRRVLEIAPTHALAAKSLGERYAEAGDFRRLLSAVAPAARAHPELADLQYLAGLGYEKAGDKTLAARHYRRALRLVPSMAEAKSGMTRLGPPK